MDFNILLNFLIAIAIGALIGIERQRGRTGTRGFAGVRTFILISFLGAITAFLVQELDYLTILPISFLAVSGLVIVAYAVSARKGYVGITAEISACITYFLGFIVMFEKYRNYGLIFGVLVTILLSIKGIIHEFVEKAKNTEWNDTLKFALIAFVILPLLPRELNLRIFEEGSRFYQLNFIAPKEIWLLVVFVSGVSFIGYFLIKSFGHEKGANILGALGGMVSSTAVTQSMATYSKHKPQQKEEGIAKTLVNSILLATIVSFLRFGIITLGINKNLFSILIPIFLLIIIGLFIFIVRSHNIPQANVKINLKSPLKLKPALILAGLYMIITMLSKFFITLNLGKSGIVITAIVTGFFDVDPIILAVSSLSVSGAITISDAIYTILLAIGANQITKSFIALTSGSKKFGRGVAKLLFLFIILILTYLYMLKF